MCLAFETVMVQMYKITTGSDVVKCDNWFQLVDSSEKLTRSTTDPLNLRPQGGQVGIEENLFLQQSC